jgi:hypothetical protein
LFTHIAEDDVLEAASNHHAASGSEQQQQRKDTAPKVDADFFNSFPDDLDESDMQPNNKPQ